MKKNNIVVNQIPIDLFELFLTDGGDVELEDESTNIKIHINSTNALEYYERYYVSVSQKQDISDEIIKYIPIYVDSSKKQLLSISEIDDLVSKGVLGKVMSCIIPFNFGHGMKDYLTIEIPRALFDEMIKIEQNLNTDIPAGTLSFSVDLMYILVKDNRFKDNNLFIFVTDIDNGDVKGLIEESDYKKGGNVKILQFY